MSPLASLTLKVEQVPLAYQPDSTCWFNYFNQVEWPSLLHSGNTDSPAARYDIFVARPLEKIAFTADLTTKEKLKQYLKLNKLLAQYPTEAHEQPFVCGLLGFVGYDVFRLIEPKQIEAHTTKDIQLPDLMLGFYHFALITDHQRQTTTLFYTLPTQESKQAITQLVDDLSQASYPSKNHFSIHSDAEANFNQTEYDTAFNQVKQHLYNGDCYQINLAQRFKRSVTGSALGLYQAIRKSNQTPFGAFLNYPDGQILSFSPERFIKCDNGIIESKPIKGTRPRGDTEKKDDALAQELLASEKDRAENLMIVDLMRNDLSRNCLSGSVEVPKIFELESYSAVHHLVSTVTGQLKTNRRLIDVLLSCFPGGSITGAPKLSAIQCIENLEPNRRHVYCGTIGYLDFSNKMDSNIAIRTLVMENNTLYYWAGGGLVLDSKAKQEYQETFDKVAKIDQVLNAHALPKESK